MIKKCCDRCKEMAVWMYMPGSENGLRCADHVPRGCSCNFEDEIDEDDSMRRLLPCCEWCFDPEGFEFD